MTENKQITKSQIGDLYTKAYIYHLGKSKKASDLDENQKQLLNDNWKYIKENWTNRLKKATQFSSFKIDQGEFKYNLFIKAGYIQEELEQNIKPINKQENIMQNDKTENNENNQKPNELFKEKVKTEGATSSTQVLTPPETPAPTLNTPENPNQLGGGEMKKEITTEDLGEALDQLENDDTTPKVKDEETPKETTPEETPTLEETPKETTSEKEQGTLEQKKA